MDCNDLIEFPQSICELPLLIKLNISCNRIKTLPTDIGRLKMLQVSQFFLTSFMILISTYVFLVILSSDNVIYISVVPVKIKFEGERIKQKYDFEVSIGIAEVSI